MSHDAADIAEHYGTASIRPTDPVVAGTFSSWTVTYTAGALGMDDGSTVKVAANMTSDWGHPQFQDPTADNYATVETSADASVQAEFDVDGHVRPFKHTVTINVFDGSLEPGETITLHLGVTGEGSLGHRVQTFPERDFEVVALVDPFGTGEFVRLPDTLAFDIRPGQPNRLAAFLPSDAAVDDSVALRIRAMDYWGNVATSFDGTVEIEGAGPVGIDTPESIPLEAGTARTAVRITDPGVHRLTVVDRATGHRATTNPIRCGGDHDDRIFWGDIHGQSGETVGTGTVQDYFAYLRDRALLDFGAHAGNDFQITDEFWTEIQSTVQRFNDPGEFVTFLCYEWSANTSIGGDHNVYFRDPSGDPAIHRSSSWQTAQEYHKHEGTFPVSALYEHYRGRDDVLIIPHRGGRPAPLDAYDPQLTPFVEILSVWGVFEWYGQEALERGYEVGFVAGSDDHTGRPGASYPTNETDWAFPIKGGVMAAKAPELTREALWEAFTSRRVYATTGARIGLDLEADGARMGEVLQSDGPVSITATVRGTAPVDRVDLVRVDETVASRSFVEGDDRIEIAWRGARSKTRHKVQDWSGGLTITDGRIETVEAIGFDHPDQGIEYQSDTELRWSGTTAGNRQSLRLTVDVPAETILRVATPPATLTRSLADLEEEQGIDAGPVDRRLTVRRVGHATDSDVRVTFDDVAPGDGPTPYYVRVRQADGEMAWSSPVFVHPSDT